MPTTRSPMAFLDTLSARHFARLPNERVYERMMYAARNPPSPGTLTPLIEYLEQERTDAKTGHGAPDEKTLTRLADVLAGMVWPDPAPIERAAEMLEGWNTVAVTALLHTQIPDYPIFGPKEAQGLRRLGYHVTYEDDPHAARAAYGELIEAVKDLRERARWDQVPESHHFLTRIMQASLEEFAHEESP